MNHLQIEEFICLFLQP